jgi:hypothetical protein
MVGFGSIKAIQQLVSGLAGDDGLTVDTYITSRTIKIGIASFHG